MSNIRATSQNPNLCVLSNQLTPAQPQTIVGTTSRNSRRRISIRANTRQREKARRVDDPLLATHQLAQILQRGEVVLPPQALTKTRGQLLPLALQNSGSAAEPYLGNSITKIFSSVFRQSSSYTRRNRSTTARCSSSRRRPPSMTINNNKYATTHHHKGPAIAGGNCGTTVVWG